jgi:Spy/CpxP family protein refolding chaperone
MKNGTTVQEEISQQAAAGFNVQIRRGGISIIRILRYRQDLGLTDNQIRDLQRLHSDFLRETIKKQADIRILQLDLSDILDNTTPDFNNARSLVQRINDLRIESEMSMLNAYEKAMLILSDEQKGFLHQLVSPMKYSGMDIPMVGDINEMAME